MLYFLAALYEGVVSPRQSAQRILSIENKTQAAVLLILLPWIFIYIFTLLSGGDPAPDAPPVFMTMLVGFVSHVFQIVITAGLITLIGRLFGGTGTMRDAVLLDAWFVVITTIFALLVLMPFLLIVGMGDPSSMVALAALAGLVVLVSVWILASFITVLHGFRSVWGPLAALLGIWAFLAYLGVTLGGT